MGEAVDADVKAYLSNRRTQLNHWFFLARLSGVLGFLLYGSVNALLGEAPLSPTMLVLGAYLVANAAIYVAVGSEAKTTPWAFAALDASLIIGLRCGFGFEALTAADPNTATAAAFALLLISYTLYGNPTLTPVLSLVALVATSAALYLDPLLTGAGPAGGERESLRAFLLVQYLSVACLVTCILALRLRRQVVAYSLELHRRMQTAVREATERAHRERLEGFNRLKRDFIETLSHELRNPISTLYPSLEFVRAEMEDGRCELDTLDIAMESAEMLERLVKDYGQLAELLTQEEEQTPRWNVDLDTLLDTLVGSERHSRFAVSDLSGLAAAGNPQLLRGALLAVLRRAELLTPSDQPITVRGFADADKTVIAVHDPTSCLGPNTVQTFDNPFSLTDERKYYSKSTGLELVLAQHALRRLGGHLDTDDGPDAPAGTTVRCYLPPAQEQLDWFRPEEEQANLVFAAP